MSLVHLPLLFVLIILPAVVLSSCSYGEPEVEKTGCRVVEILNDVTESLFVVSRKQSLPELSFVPPFFKTELGVVKYCLYKGVKILPMGRFKDLDECVEVRCYGRRYTKCGFGKKAGVMIPPPGCKNAFLGCNVKIIQDPKTKTPCPVKSPGF